MLENDYMLSDKGEEIRKEAKDLAKGINPDLLRKMDREEVDYPWEFYKEAAERNLLGLRFPEEYGGRDCTWLTETAALEEIGVLGLGIGCCYSMPSIVGEAINRFGTEYQKEEYLKPMLEGEKLSAEGLTEPRGGSDFYGTATTARKEGDHYVINGQKRFIAGGSEADFYLLYAKTDPEAPSHEALSTFLVDKDMGVEIEERYGLMGFRGMGTSRILLKDVEVPEENLVGNENDGGTIFNYMMVPERLTSAAGAIGTGRAALEVAMKYSRKREAFGKKIKDFEGVSFKVAESITMLDAARGLAQTAAKCADVGDDPRQLVSEAKQFCTDIAWDVANEAMQILGGIGYTQVFPVERLLRDLRLGKIWTGSNEIMKLLVQHEAYRDFEGGKEEGRDIEKDAVEVSKAAEKVYDISDQKEIFEKDSD